MKQIHSLLAIVVLLTTGCSRTRDAAAVLADAQKAMGNPASIQYSGTGMNAFFGQALTAGQEWPRRDLTAYTRAIDYDKRASREEMTFAQAVFGGQQQNAEVAGDKAWNIGANGPVPQPVAAEERQLMIWLSPHGFLKAAASSGNATLTPGNDGSSTVGFTALGKYKVEGTIDANNLVTRVATTIANPVLGDTGVVATYGDYKDYGGVKFPSKIAVQQGGFPLWDLTITSVTPNVPLDLPVPAAVASAAVPPVSVVSTRLGPGVWHVTGGSHHSAVVEFADYTAVVEAPLNEERSLAVLAEARKLAPGKPVRYILTTHHHFDHTGGLRTYAAEGATIVTHQSNVPYFTRTLVAPATVSPDAQTNAQKMPTFQAVADTYELTDGTQKIQVYATDGDAHTNEYTLIYLPGSKVLIEADAYSPGPADAPPPAVPPPNAVKLLDEIQRLKLNVDTIAPVHGRGAVPIAELRKFVGKA
ncbi:MAG TPA: MBL fold metallo-hydrolase [Vicinamibacterales bacterium]|nr:MBL fold metallo-hydrolase [Vicinamibacterales bacterium]